ncbi:hypothetical protein QTP88_003423 [Uroleucon formosanum]
MISGYLICSWYLLSTTNKGFSEVSILKRCSNKDFKIRDTSFHASELVSLSPNLGQDIPKHGLRNIFGFFKVHTYYRGEGLT